MRTELQHMVYEEVRPTHRLWPWVLVYWHFRVAPDAGEVMHTVPLTGASMLSISLRAQRVALNGPRTMPLQVPVYGGDEYWGVHFVPGAAELLLGRTLRDAWLFDTQFADAPFTQHLLTSVTHSSGLSEVGRALDRCLLEWFSAAPQVDSKVLLAASLLIESQGMLPISQVARQTHLSERQLRRRFQQATGLSPKEFARMRRVRSAAIDAVNAQQLRWCAIAADHGFTDQAHLSAEFTRTMGLSPSAYMRYARRIAFGGVV